MTNHNQRAAVLLLTLLLAVGAVKSAWLADDAFITLRTVRNLLDGFGPVWNVGERVQAYTHPLWMFLLTGAVALTHEYYYTSLLLWIFTCAGCVLHPAALSCHQLDRCVAGWRRLDFVQGPRRTYATSGLENPFWRTCCWCYFLSST